MFGSVCTHQAAHQERVYLMMRMHMGWEGRGALLGILWGKRDPNDQYLFSLSFLTTLTDYFLFSWFSNFGFSHISLLFLHRCNESRRKTQWDGKIKNKGGDFVGFCLLAMAYS